MGIAHRLPPLYIALAFAYQAYKPTMLLMVGKIKIKQDVGMTLCQKLLKQEGTTTRIESMQQSSATPLPTSRVLGVAEDCCMLSIILAVPCCSGTYILLHF